MSNSGAKRLKFTRGLKAPLYNFFNRDAPSEIQYPPQGGLGTENLACTRIQYPDCPARRVSIPTTPSQATFLEHLKEYFHSLKKIQLLFKDAGKSVRNSASRSVALKHSISRSGAYRSVQTAQLCGLVFACMDNKKLIMKYNSCNFGTRTTE
jgi:hypothetical protein